MTPITASTIFPLKYPKGDPSIPLQGALAVPVEIDFSQDTQFEIYLQQLREQNNFGSLRCIWIDNSANSESIVVAINGTDQILNVPANSQNYYAVIILNLPTVTLTVSSLAETATPVRLIFLNFVPFIPIPPQLTISGTVEIAGTVAVSNFPNPQNVNVENASIPVTQSGSWDVTVNQPVSVIQGGAWTASISNFPATQAVTQSGSWTVAISNATLAVTQSGTWNVNAVQSGTWSVSVANFPATQTIAGTVSVSNFPTTQGVNLAQLNAVALGSPSNYGTSPGAIAVQGVNAFVTNTISTQGVATKVGANYGTSSSGTTAFNITGTAPNALQSISVYSLNAYNSGGGTVVQINDSNGNLLFTMSIPLPTASNTESGLVLALAGLNSPLGANASGHATAQFNTALSGGSLLVAITYY
jgi:hypothetical protein